MKINWRENRVWIVIALLVVLTCICTVILFYLRSNLWPGAKPTKVPTPVLAQVTPKKNIDLPQTLPTSPPVPTPTTGVRDRFYRVISIDKNDVGTFKNEGDGSILYGHCIDPKLPWPALETRYILNKKNVLFPAQPDLLGAVQRFSAVAGQ
jgi:hypothetical protein